MARTVDEGFKTLISWISATTTETQAAASHRASIDACLRANFGSVRLFRSGSFGHNTSVSGFSDVDYFAVLPKTVFTINSTSTLVKVKNALSARFPRTNVAISSPAIVIPFGVLASERHEIIPADYMNADYGYKSYDIPDRHAGWMLSSPQAHNAWVNTEQVRLSNKLKDVIRLVKYWNYVKDVGLRSFYIELRLTEYAKGEATIIPRIDVKGALKHMLSKNLAAMQDPMRISGLIKPCSDAVKASAITKLSTAYTRAEKALQVEHSGDIYGAFSWWDKLYDGNFPAYY